jgi:hypothetical protein
VVPARQSLRIPGQCGQWFRANAIIMPTVNTEAMNEHLKEISTQVAPGAHADLVCDGAGWHQQGKRLRTPHNITLLDLPRFRGVLSVWDQAI